jgi:hypothetical protein
MEELFSKIVTGGETWVYHSCSESIRDLQKRQGRRISSRKMMATVFWDMEEILLIEDIKNALK